MYVQCSPFRREPFVLDAQFAHAHPNKARISRERMKCVARISWTTCVGTYQSYRLGWKEDEEGTTAILCASIASDSTMKLSVKKGEVRTLARNHVEDGRATVIFEKQAMGVTEVDIREAVPSQLNAFLDCLQCLQVSRPSPARLKRKLNLSTR